MVGRTFGVVMACSFCCAPLHAVRFAWRNRTRCREVPGRLAACAACFPDRFGDDLGFESKARFTPPTALGGYRVQGCQVTEKCRSNRAKRAKYLRHTGRRNVRQPRQLGYPIRARRERDYALALLSTARDRKSTRLNSSHTVISYAVFCLKKKNMKL